MPPKTAPAPASMAAPVNAKAKAQKATIEGAEGHHRMSLGWLADIERSEMAQRHLILSAENGGYLAIRGMAYNARSQVTQVVEERTRRDALVREEMSSHLSLLQTASSSLWFRLVAEQLLVQSENITRRNAFRKLSAFLTAQQSQRVSSCNSEGDCFFSPSH